MTFILRVIFPLNIALGRMPKLEKDFNIKVESIVNLDSLIDFVKENGVYTDHLDRLNEYRKNWGA